MKLVLRALSGLVIAGLLVGGAYFISGNWDNSSSVKTKEIPRTGITKRQTQPQTQQNQTDPSQRNAIGNLKLR